MTDGLSHARTDVTTLRNGGTEALTGIASRNRNALSFVGISVLVNLDFIGFPRAQTIDEIKDEVRTVFTERTYIAIGTLQASAYEGFGDFAILGLPL